MRGAQLIGPARRDQAPPVQDDDVLKQVLDLIDLVGGDDDGGPLAQIQRQQLVPEAAPHHDVHAQVDLALDAVLALACHCPVLLLDEIHLGMDVVVRRRFWDELLATYLRERPTVVISSHQVDEIEDLLEDVVVLHRGRLAATGTADELRAAHSRPGQGLASLSETLIDITEGDLS